MTRDDITYYIYVLHTYIILSITWGFIGQKEIEPTRVTFHTKGCIGQNELE